MNLPSVLELLSLIEVKDPQKSISKFHICRCAFLRNVQILKNAFLLQVTIFALKPREPSRPSRINGRRTAFGWRKPRDIWRPVGELGVLLLFHCGASSALVGRGLIRRCLFVTYSYASLSLHISHSCASVRELMRFLMFAGV